MAEQRSPRKGTYYINISSVSNADHGYILIQESEAHIRQLYRYKSSNSKVNFF